jgi:hypothetical protein
MIDTLYFVKAETAKARLGSERYPYGSLAEVMQNIKENQF